MTQGELVCTLPRAVQHCQVLTAKYTLKTAVVGGNSDCTALYVQETKIPRSQLQQITWPSEAKDFLDNDLELKLFPFFSVIFISAGASKVLI